MTCGGSDADEERAFNDGIADYIVKPIKPTIVLARVRSQLLVRQARHWLQDQNQALEAEVAALRDTVARLCAELGMSPAQPAAGDEHAKNQGSPETH